MAILTFRRRLIALGIIAVVLLSLYLFWRLPNESSSSVDNNCPIKCRIVLATRRERIPLAAKLLESRFSVLDAAALIDNPLIMNDDYARVVVENTSDKSVRAYVGDTDPPGKFGSVKTEIRAEDGTERYYYYPASRSLHQLSPEILARLEGSALESSLGPGEMCSHDLSLFGLIDRKYQIEPGTYRIRAVLSYHEIPHWTERKVYSGAITVRVSRRHIDQWKALLEDAP